MVLRRTVFVMLNVGEQRVLWLVVEIGCNEGRASRKSRKDFMTDIYSMSVVHGCQNADHSNVVGFGQ